MGVGLTYWSNVAQTSAAAHGFAGSELNLPLGSFAVLFVVIIGLQLMLETERDS
jgi:hypothetical protein